MKKHILVIATWLMSFHAFCQHEAGNWIFGVFAGLNFTNGTPVVISSNSTLNTNEGCSSISDSAGNLLFYTDGITVWNKQFTVMPNGTGLMGDISSSQSALIVPLPGSNKMYYLFTLDELGGPKGFRYNIIDMSLDSGRGNVATKNTLILNNVTERQAALRNDQTNEYWITVHEWGSDAFYSYRLTSTGLSNTPVISNSGIVHSNTKIQYTFGQMKFSTCGDKLALAAGYLDTVEVFHFDINSGVISNPITIPMTDHVYGLEFSRDQTKLYVGCYDPLQTLVQFDISSGNAATIIASQTPLSQTPDIYAMQIAPDNKIYVCRSFSQFLGVINNPDVAGISCNYVDNGIDLDPNFLGVTSALGLPEFYQSRFNPAGEPTCTISTSIHSVNSVDKNIIYPNPSSGTFTLQLSNMNPVSKILIQDNLGRTIEQYSDLQNRNELSFGNNLSPGVYFATLLSESSAETLMIAKTGH